MNFLKANFFGLLKSRISLLTLWLIFGSVMVNNIQEQAWNKENRVIASDVLHYYYYTVSVIVYHDFDSDRVYSQIPSEIRRILVLPSSEETGKIFPKMAMGLSIIYAPFTAFAHYILVPLTGAMPDGYSAPYKIGLLLSSIVFFLFGLWNLRKVLLLHYSETVTALTLLIVAFGTNLTWYVTSEPAMSHVYSFALVIYLYRLLYQWFKNPATGLTILTGFIFGLVVLIRPTNIIFIALFFATGNFRERIQFLLRNYAKILLMMSMFVLLWIPQFVFWKYAGGSWFLYTYGDETFFWNNPQVISSLFSFRKGWLVYSPLMALAFIGLPVLWKQNRSLFWQVSSVLALLIYVNSSWWCWWFGGGFGLRTYIDGYGIFALSIGAVIHAVAGLKRITTSAIGGILLAAFIYLSLFETWQYNKGLIHWDSMTYETYKLNFLKTQHTKNFYSSLVLPDYKAAKRGIYYTRNELTRGQGSLIRYNIQQNQPYLIRYYEGISIKNPDFQKDLHRNAIPQNQLEAFRNSWAQKKYQELSGRQF